MLRPRESSHRECAQSLSMARLPWGAALALWGSLALCDSRPEADIEGDDDAYKYSGSAGFEQVAYSGDLETAAGIYEPLRPEEDPCVMRAVSRLMRDRLFSACLRCMRCAISD
jgi:hypothetical protein